MNKRINWLSILQGWAILWVVIGHAPLDSVTEPMPVYVHILYSMAYSFHMPLFAWISGFLFNRSRVCNKDREWSYFSMLSDKVKSLLVPSVFFSVIALCLKILLPSKMERPIDFSFDYLLETMLFPGRGPLSEIWFIVALLWFFALMPFWKLMLKSKLWKVLILSVLFIPILVPVKCDFLCIGDTLSLAFYFAIGFLSAGFSKDFFKYSARSFLIGLILILAYSITMIFDIPVLPAILGISLSIVIAIILNHLLPSIFVSFRERYFQIFLMGIFVQILVKILYHHFHFSYILAYITCIILGIYIPVFISNVVSKCAPPFVCLLFGIKKQ